MALDPRIPLQGVPYQVPNFDLGATYAQIARIQALEEQRRSSEVQRRGAEQALSRQDAWRQAMSTVLAPPQTQPQGQGLTAAPPAQPLGQPSVPPQQGLTAPVGQGYASPPGSSIPPYAGPSLADAVPPASPAQGMYGLTAPQEPPGAMPPSFARAPSAMQPAGLWAPPGPQQGLTAPQGPPQGLPPPPGMVPPGMAPPPAGQPPAQGLTAPTTPSRAASPVAKLFKPLNMEALQQAAVIDPEKTTQWLAHHVQLQGQQLAQAKQRTTAMYTVGKRILASDNPQKAYEIGMKQLRDQGIPIPDDLPATYDAAHMAFTVDSLRTLDIDLAELNVKQEEQKLQLLTFQAQTERGKMLNEGRKPEMDQAKLQIDAAKLGEVEYLDTPQGRMAVPKYPGAAGAEVGARPVTVDGKPVPSTAGQTQLHQTRSAEQQAQAHYDLLAKPYRDVRDAMGRIEAAGTSPTPAGDMALLYAYVKMLDPETGIRNEETKNAEQLGGWPAQAHRWLARVQGGEPLTEKVRNDFMDRSKKLYAQYQKDYEYVAQQYRKQVSSQGLNPDNVVLDYRSQTRAGGEGQTGQASAGGFDPAAFQSWQKSQSLSGPPTAARVEQYFQSRGLRKAP